MSTSDDDRLPAAAAEPPPRLVEDVHNVLTPMGEVQSLGQFARGLGARRLTIAIGVFGGLAMLLALLQALS